MTLAIGTTSAPVTGGSCYNGIACAIADASYSRGQFFLTAGFHSLTGLQTIGAFGTAAVFIISADPNPPAPPTVPLPTALPLLASGLGALGFIGWRRKRKETAAAA